MDIISYNVVEEKSEDGHFNIVNNIEFRNKNWFKTSLIEMLEKQKNFMALQNKEKLLLCNILSGDLLNPKNLVLFISSS
jgi:hypothetical protein